MNLPPSRYLIIIRVHCAIIPAPGSSLPAPATGVVKAINFEPGASVAKDATILVIGK
jgi:hypothetical protein